MASKIVQDFFTFDEDIDEDEEIVDETLLTYMKNTNIHSTHTISDKLWYPEEKGKKHQKIKKKIKKEFEKSHQVEFIDPDTPNRVKVQDEFLDAVTFKPRVKQCNNMNIELAHIISIESWMLNTECVKALKLLTQNLSSINLKNRKEGKPLITVEELSKNLKDKDGKVLTRWIVRNINETSCFKRSHFASAVSGKLIAIHGGKSNKGTYNDLILWDTMSGKVKIVSNLSAEWSSVAYNSTAEKYEIPPLSGHKMVFCGNSRDIFILGGNAHAKINRLNYRSKEGDKYADEMVMFSCSNVDDLNQIMLGFQTKDDLNNIISYHPVREEGTKTYVTQRSDFACCYYPADATIYLFGGTSNGVMGKDDFYKITMTRGPYYRQAFSVRDVSTDFCPPKRFGHTMDLVKENVLICGGRDGEKILNDVWIYEVGKFKWKEIICNDVVPPSICFHSTFIVNAQSLIIYGGKTESDSCSHTIWECNLDTAEWKLVRILSRTDVESHDLQVDVSGHQCLTVGADIYMIGGFDGVKPVDNLAVIREPMDFGTDDTLRSYLWKKKQEEYLCDMKLIVKDKEGQDRIIKAHKCVLGVRCPSFAEIFKTDKESYDINDTIFEILDPYIEFLYTGNLVVKQNLAEFLDFVMFWNSSAYEQMQAICFSKSSFVQATEWVIEQLEQDLVELVAADDYSDCTLVMGDETIPAHKIILCRSPYFHNMISSGMSESINGIIDLEGLDPDPLLEILCYLYTDQVNVSQQQCIGVLIYSLMFQLYVLVNNCRTMASQNFSTKNVIQLMELAELHNDQILKRLCINFIKKHDDIVHLKEFGEIDPKLKETVLIAVKKYQDNEKKKLKSRKNQQKDL